MGDKWEDGMDRVDDDDVEIVSARVCLCVTEFAETSQMRRINFEHLLKVIIVRVHH